MADSRPLIDALRADFSPAQKVRDMIAPPRRPDTLAPGNPTNRQKFAAALSGDSKIGSVRRNLVRGIVGEPDRMGLLDFTPAAVGFLDESVRKAGTPGQRPQGLLELGMAAVPIPAAKGAARGLAKAAPYAIIASSDSEVLAAAKQMRQHLLDVGIPAHRIDHSVNRNGDHSAYIETPFGAVRVSDHSSANTDNRPDQLSSVHFSSVNREYADSLRGGIKKAQDDRLRINPKARFVVRFD